MKALAALLLAAALTGCTGIESRNVNGKWVDDGRGGQVWCIGADDGGITCDWDHRQR